ncbi:MAG: undecaprenyl/decaprenyl-phosphate alpha-N-acetylglucosaminyl 1-phosphate transferase [Planctomycetes bacterium]|nr:undecaprenyl/decaprenyl-phosphate alpha-N-acetylglucosaminyl 1-phosphate transferase [Planctomycetota bacterium]
MLAFIFGDEHTVWDIIARYWIVFPVAFAVGLIATPICQRLANRFGIVDLPDNAVKTHKRPTAYLGGIGILAGLLAGLAAGFWILNGIPGEHDSIRWLVGIAVGAIIACGVGLLDDIVELGPRKKLLGQSVAAVLLWAVGVRPNMGHLFNQVSLILGYGEFDLPAAWESILGLLVVWFFIVGATNSLNLIDGLDGLCAGVTAIFTIAYLLLAVILATWDHSPDGDPIRLILCLALVGATLGFFPMNRYPARIFMGDAGSGLLGFLAGALMILFAERFGKWSIAAVVIFGLPILDTAVALVRRLISKRPLFVSDRGHIYDQFMDRGWGLKKSVKVCYLLAGIYALIGLATGLLRFRGAAVVFVIVVLVSGWMVFRWGFLRYSHTASKNKTEPTGG